ncbi:DJ-1/PfpI family protein, partial [bacterium]|nr:DJ-1/PfpI family protein [bacterium]
MRKISPLLLGVLLLVMSLNALGITHQKQKFLVVIAQKDFQQVEFSAVKQALEKNGYVVIVASNSKAEAIAMDKKTKVRPDIAIKDAKEKDYIGISIIGGNGSP